MQTISNIKKKQIILFHGFPNSNRNYSGARGTGSFSQKTEYKLPTGSSAVTSFFEAVNLLGECIMNNCLEISDRLFDGCFFIFRIVYLKDRDESENRGSAQKSFEKSLRRGGTFFLSSKIHSF